MPYPGGQSQINVRKETKARVASMRGVYSMSEDKFIQYLMQRAFSEQNNNERDGK